MAPRNKCCGDANHNHDDLERGIEYSLYRKINTNDLECLNEVVPDSGKTVFKSWENRMDTDSFVRSDMDEELLFNIPFVGNVKLTGIIIIGDSTDAHPSRMRLFKNREFMTFDDAECEADQEFELQRDTQGVLEYATKIVTFQNVNHLSIHFPSNFGEEFTVIYYIGLKGQFTEAHRHGVTICNYELRPNMSEHKNPLNDNVHSPIA